MDHNKKKHLKLREDYVATLQQLRQIECQLRSHKHVCTEEDIKKELKELQTEALGIPEGPSRTMSSQEPEQGRS